MKTWNNIDKTDWNDGEWKNEPDKAHWIDEKSKLDCLIVRGPAGALCGYVGIPKSHPFFGKDYDETGDFSVHGGLTFADRCRPSNDESKGICHPEDGAANTEVWWFGFDCAHSGDITPKYDWSYSDYSQYRNFSYVKREVESLAAQMADNEN